MPTHLDTIKKFRPAHVGWEFATVAIIAITGLLTSLAVATATSLNLIDMPF